MSSMSRHQNATNRRYVASAADLSTANTTSTGASSGMMVRRKKRDLTPKPRMELEHIFGLTTGNNTALAAHPTQDIIAYLAGSVVVLYDHRRNKQIGFLTANSPYTPLSSSDATVGLSPSNGTGGNGMSVSANAVSYSSIGYGSSSGNSSSLNGSNTAGNPNLASTRMAMKKHAHAPLKTLICLAISADGNYLAAGEIGHRPRILIWDLKTYNLVAQLRGHRFGVLSISFSPNNKFLVSCGLQHDGFLYIWQWRQGIKLTSNKIVNKTQSIVFSKNGSFCVTSGQRFVKYWYLDTNGNLPSCKTSTKDSQSPRTVRILQGRSGILADLCNNTFLDAACGTGPNGAEYTYLVASTGLLCLFVKDRVLDRWVDLQVKSAKCVDVSSDFVVCGGSDGIVRLFEPVTLTYIGSLPKPHPLGIEFNKANEQVPSDSAENYPDCIALKINHCGRKVTCIYSDHSIYVWDITEIYRIGRCRSILYHSASVWGVEMLPIKKTANAAFPSNTFVTYSSDGSVRFWNLHPNRPIGTRNIGGKELLHQFYVDPTWKQSVRRRDPLPRQSFSTSDAIDGTVVGVRAIDISPDARYLATGDRAGNLRVHDLSTFDLIAYHEAHDAEILTIDFSKPMRVKDEYLLASAGRDRLVHIFDVRDTFRLQQTLDEHSSSITGVKFADRGRRLISCGADKSIVFRSKHEDATFSTYHLHAGRVTIYDMDVDDIQNQMTVATQNRLVNVLDISSGKIINSVRPDNRTDDLSSAEGNLIRIALDPSGSYAVTAGTDKRVRLHDLGTGATVACVGGHSELITGVRITRDCARVISTSGDGCIFVWRIDRPVVSHMRSRAIKRGVILSTVRETSRSSRPAEPIPEGEVSDAPMRRQSSADTLRDNRRHSSGSKFANTTNNYFTGGRNSSLASGGHTSPLKSSLGKLAKGSLSSTDLQSNTSSGEDTEENLFGIHGSIGEDHSGGESDPEFLLTELTGTAPGLFQVTCTSQSACLTPSPSIDSDDKNISDSEEISIQFDDCDELDEEDDDEEEEEEEEEDGDTNNKSTVSFDEYLLGPIPIATHAMRNSISNSYLQTIGRRNGRSLDLSAMPSITNQDFFSPLSAPPTMARSIDIFDTNEAALIIPLTSSQQPNIGLRSPTLSAGSRSPTIAPVNGTRAQKTHRGLTVSTIMGTVSASEISPIAMSPTAISTTSITKRITEGLGTRKNGLSSVKGKASMHVRHRSSTSVDDFGHGTQRRRQEMTGDLEVASGQRRRNEPLDIVVESGSKPKEATTNRAAIPATTRVVSTTMKKSQTEPSSERPLQDSGSNQCTTLKRDSTLTESLAKEDQLPNVNQLLELVLSARDKLNTALANYRQLIEAVESEKISATELNTIYQIRDTLTQTQNELVEQLITLPDDPLDGKGRHENEANDPTGLHESPPANKTPNTSGKVSLPNVMVEQVSDPLVAPIDNGPTRNSANPTTIDPMQQLLVQYSDLLVQMVQSKLDKETRL